MTLTMLQSALAIRAATDFVRVGDFPHVRDSYERDVVSRLRTAAGERVVFVASHVLAD